jgi:hypothetical protein
MMEELGARLFAIWATTPYNGHWPQITIIWEIDAFADYARIGRAQARGGSHVETAAKWAAFLSEIGATGEGRIMYAGASNKALAQLKESNFTAGLVIQEIMQTKPGRQDDYIRELERLYVPWSVRPLAVRPLVGADRQAVARLVHHHVPLQRGHPLLGVGRRLGLLRQPLPVVERQSAGRNRHLDERRTRPA